MHNGLLNTLNSPHFGEFCKRFSYHCFYGDWERAKAGVSA